MLRNDAFNFGVASYGFEEHVERRDTAFYRQSRGTRVDEGRVYISLSSRGTFGGRTCTHTRAIEIYNTLCTRDFTEQHRIARRRVRHSDILR